MNSCTSFWGVWKFIYLFILLTLRSFLVYKCSSIDFCLLSIYSQKLQFWSGSNYMRSVSFFPILIENEFHWFIKVEVFADTDTYDKYHIGFLGIQYDIDTIIWLPVLLILLIFYLMMWYVWYCQFPVAEDVSWCLYHFGNFKHCIQVPIINWDSLWTIFACIS